MRTVRNALAVVGEPYAYLETDRLFIKAGALKLGFPGFPTRNFKLKLKRLASLESHFIAPEVLSGNKS